MNKHIPIPKMDQRIKEHEGYGLVQVIHGHGKGKTTSALGLAIRCTGSGHKVKIIYFDKGGSDHYFERIILDRIPEIDYSVTGRDRIDPKTNQFDFSIQEIDKNEAERGMRIAKEACKSKEYDLVILDEINSTVDLDMVSVQTVLDLIRKKYKKTELVLTGRNPHKLLLDEAHLISNVSLERHYFYSGVQARKGLDY